MLGALEVGSVKAVEVDGADPELKGATIFGLPIFSRPGRWVEGAEDEATGLIWPFVGRSYEADEPDSGREEEALVETCSPCSEADSG